METKSLIDSSPVVDLSENKLDLLENEVPPHDQLTSTINQDEQVIAPQNATTQDISSGMLKKKKVFSDIFQRPKKVIIDCDPGADDAHAIVLAIYFAKAHNVEILGITTAACNHTVDQVTKNAQIILEVCKEQNIMVYKGGQRDDFEQIDYYFGPDGFGNFAYTFEKQNGEIGTKHLHQDSAQKFLIESVQQYPNEITIICVGALTNITRAIAEYPNFKSQIRDIVQMGGTHQGQGNAPNWCSEYNFYMDSTSAKILLEQLGEKMTIVSYELCYNFYHALTQEELAAIFDQDNEIARMVKGSYSVSCQAEGGKYPIYDQIAIAIAFQPELVLAFVEKQCRVVDDHPELRGLMLINWLDQGVDETVPKSRIITKIDEVALKEYLQDCLSSDSDVYQKRIENNHRNQQTLMAYLEAVGLPRHLKLTPSVETLHMVVNRHVLAVPYQNFHFHFKLRQPLSFDFHDLVQRMVVERKGGLCCEQSVLMYQILTQIGFKVNILLAQVLAFKPYIFSQDKDFTHSMNLVEVDGVNYIVDVGFGHLSLRYPLKIDLNCEEQIQYQQTISYENYSITRNNDHYLLSFMLNDYYNGSQYPFQLYAFRNPIQSLSVSEVFEQYMKLLFTKKHTTVSNKIIFVGQPTYQGYINYQYQPKSEIFTALRERLWCGQLDRYYFHTYAEFANDVYYSTGVILPDPSIIRYYDNNLECDQQIVYWLHMNKGIKSDIINIKKLEQIFLEERVLISLDKLKITNGQLLPENYKKSAY
eukprot:403335108